MNELTNSISLIRDVLRTEGITGKDSINHCVAFLVCRYLDENLCLKLNIPNKFSFNNFGIGQDGRKLLELEIYEKFYRRGHPDCMMYYLVNTFHMTVMKDFKVKSPINLARILSTLKELDIRTLNTQCDLIGIIYELHLKTGSSGSGMRDLGQYFTNRKVISYMVKLCDPKIINGQMETLLDPTMGTGGFLTMTLKYLRNKYGVVDWDLNKNRLFGFDIDNDIRILASLNLLLETGYHFPHLLTRDTLHDDMVLDDNTPVHKVQILLANEPMGLKNITHASCCDRIKDLKIRGTKAEPLFMQLFMLSLDLGGRACIIVPDGFLFNDTSLHCGTRKYLIENFEVHKIISLNDDFFLNTGVKTSIIFFEKTGHKTQETTFSEVKFDENEEIVENVLQRVTYQELLSHNYSLFINKYLPDTRIRYEGVKYYKLGDICQFLPKSKRLASFGQNEGLYPFYGSSVTPKKCNEADYPEECIIIGTGGNANIKYGNNFSCSTDNFIIQNNHPQNSTKYIYYYILNHMEILEQGFHGTTIKHLSKEHIKNIEIPIPSLEIQQSIVERLDDISQHNELITKSIKHSKKHMKWYVEVHTMYGQRVKLGDICQFLPKSKRLASFGQDEGTYPFYGSSMTPKRCNEADYHEECIIIGTGGNANIKYGNNFSCSTDNFIIQNNHLQNLTKYIYYYILNHMEILEQGFHGTTIKHLSKEYIKTIEIPIPTLDKQQELVSYCDDLTNLINQLENQMNNNLTLMKQILTNYLTESQKSPMVELTTNISQPTTRGSPKKSSDKYPCHKCKKEYTTRTLKMNNGLCGRCAK